MDSKKNIRAGKYWVPIVLAIFLIVFTAVNLIFLLSGDGAILSSDEAFAEVNPNRFSYNQTVAPTVSPSLVAYDYAGESYISTSVILDVSNPDVWMSKTTANASQSIFGKLALDFETSAYKYTKVVCAFSDDGQTISTGGTVSYPQYSQLNHDPEGVGTGTLINTSDNVITEIYISGTTWYGKSINNFNMLSNNGRDVEAGNYTITGVTCTKFSTEVFEYTKGLIIPTYNCTQNNKEGESGDPIEVLEEMSYSDSSTINVTPKSEIKLFLKATLTYGSSIGALVEGNLGIDAVYDSTTQWMNNVKIIADKSSIGSNQYAYAYTGNTTEKKDFNVSYGFVTGLSNTSFSIAQTISGYGTIASHLKIAWYENDECETKIESESTISARTYYLRIEVAGNANWVNDELGKNYLINFVFGNDEYLQEFIVSKKILKISFKDQLGIDFIYNEENGQIEADFSEPYTQVQLAYSQDQQSIPASETMYQKSGDSYVATNYSIFESGIAFYRNKCSANEVLDNLIVDQAGWLSIGGYASDWNLVDGEQLFGFDGSYFPGTQICSYEYMRLYLYFAIPLIGDKYDFDFGEYRNNEWVSYSSIETDGQTRQIAITTDANKNKEETLSKSSALRAYEVYGNFAVVAPRIDLSLGALIETLNDGAIPYGTIWSSSEIDYSPVVLTSSSISEVVGKAATYDLKTAEADWRIKIVGDTAQMVMSADKNYIYILMQLAKEKTGAKGENDYESYDEKLYSPYSDTLYGGLYYITYSAYYMRKGDATATKINGITKGKVDVKTGDIGIASLYLKEPSPLNITKVNLYLELMTYTPDKYYDGTDAVLRSPGSTEKAYAVLRQQEGYTLSPTIAGMTDTSGNHYSSILEYDEALHIYCVYSIKYMSLVASDEEHTIYCTYDLEIHGGSIPNFNQIKNNCYDLASVIYYDGEPAPDLSGHILYRPLNINILENPMRITDPSHEDYVEAPYSRSYGKDTRVAIRVATYEDHFTTSFDGKSLLEVYNMDNTRVAITPGLEYYADYYYYYDDSTGAEKKYYFFSELPDIFRGVSYILLEITDIEDNPNSGFLHRVNDSPVTIEGFDWDEGNMGIVKFYNNPDTGSDEAFDPRLLFIDKENIIHLLGGNETEYVVLNEQTNAGLYKIPTFNNVPFINYIFSFSAESPIETPIDFEITKIKLDPDETLIYQEEDMDAGRYLIYSKTENISKVFTSDVRTSFINLQHDELGQIVADQSYPHEGDIAIFSSLVTVTRFWMPYSDLDHDTNPMEEIANGRTPLQTELDVSSNNSVKNMILAGWYYLKVSAPETENYRGTYKYVVVRVHPKTVEVYTTIAIRTYMSDYDPTKEVRVDPDAATRKLELTTAELSDYIAYVDDNTYELSSDGSTGSPVYVYYSNKEDKIIDSTYIHIYYVGFADGDTFTPIDTEATIEFNLSSFYLNGVFIDKAGIYEINSNDERYINVFGASKQNYVFNYIMGALYIKRQALVMYVEDNQAITYSGESIAPVNSVVTEDGGTQEANVIQFIAGFYAKVGNEYKILIRNYDDNTLYEAVMSSSPEAGDENDYYYFFNEYYDYDHTLIDVQKSGTILSFIRDTVTYRVYESGSELYYYKDNDPTHGKRFITQKSIVIYRDNTGEYYYMDNNILHGKTYLSRNVQPDFRKEVDDEFVGYVDVVDGKRIYINIYESDMASLDRNVIDVFYYEENSVLYEGGYILKAYAEPGGSSSNYRRTGMYTLFLRVEKLEIDLIDNSDSYYDENLHVETVVNPIQTTQFNDREFVVGAFGDYYVGRTLTDERIALLDGWANVEITVVDGVKQFATQVSGTPDFVLTATREFAKYQNGNTASFDKALTTADQVLNAGLYIILMKVTINDNYVLSGQAEGVNMRRNLSFASTSSQVAFDGSVKTSDQSYVAYFVLYLIVDRSSDISFVVYQNQDYGDTGHVDFVSKEAFGAEEATDGMNDYFVKTYNGLALSMDISVTVADFIPKNETEESWNGGSSNGEIVNIRQYVSTTSDYMNGAYEYYRKDNGTLTLKWVDNISVSLVHCNTFYITFVINYNDSNDSDSVGSYNNNYATIIAVYQVRIDPKSLSVNIHTGVFDENDNEYGAKNYGQKNSDVEGQFSITYGELTYDESVGQYVKHNDFIEADEYLRALVTDVPVIDWDTAGLTMVNPEDPTEDDPEGQRIPAGSYYLNTKGGTEPVTTVTIGGKEKKYTDYKFIRNGGFSFVVRKLQYSIGGNSYPLVDIASSGVYTGSEQTITITKYGWDRQEIGDSEMTKPIQKSAYPAYLEGDFGNVVAQYYYIGPINNYNPMIHTREYFNSSRLFNSETGAENGGPAYDLYMDNHEYGNTIVDPVDVGFYLFYVVIPDSTNYLGVDVGYWIYEVEKSELILQFYNINTNEVTSGYASRTYTGTEGDYPVFYVKYSGLKGEDNFGNSTLTGDEAIVKFKPETVADGYTVTTNFGLKNPLYQFVDKNGVPLSSGNGTKVYMPIDAGEYNVDLMFDDDTQKYGWSINYYITVQYELDQYGNNIYPKLEIKRRLVGVTFEESNTKITKVYDGTDEVLEGTVEPAGEGYSGNYTFSRKMGDIGLIPGDNISLQINFAASRYARWTVLDEYGKESDIIVYLSVDSELKGAQASNYVLSLDPGDNLTSLVDINGAQYVSLIGTIKRATASIRFLNDNGQSVTTRRVIYTGGPQPAIVRVDGVNGEVLTMEAGDYTIHYFGEVSKYDGEDPPKNCDMYSVQITVTDPNYNETPSTSYLEINRADVTIVFGGEGVQMYGNVTVGLTATANGVAADDYSKILSVEYYTMNEDGSAGELVNDISLAPAGKYVAVAIHKETDNYNYKRATEEFTVSQRDVYVNDDVFTSMVYTGASVSVKIYFVDNGNIYYPNLMFDKLVDGAWTPANYTYNSPGNIAFGANPANVGKYRVKAYEYYQDFHISDAAWREFTIEKAELIVKVSDITVKEGTSYSITSILKNCLTNDKFDRVVSGIKYRFYDASTNTFVSETYPTRPGTYKVIGYDAVAENYNITYQFGLLTINKAAMTINVQSSTSSGGDKASIQIEGSFASDMQISVSEVENSDYSEIKDAFDLFKTTNSDFIGFTVSKVFVFDYTNYSATSNGSSMRIKLHIPGLLPSSASNAAYADGDNYYVAILAENGDLTIANATVDGEYLSFDANNIQIKAVSVLTMQEKETDSYDWLLYVGIGVGVLLIVAAVVIVAKRA